MARFIGYVQGQAGEVSRLGSPRSGITAQAQGWDVGVRVVGHNRDGEDEFAIFSTGGSSGSSGSKHLGTVRIEDGVPIFRLTDRFKVEMNGPDPVVTVA